MENSESAKRLLRDKNLYIIFSITLLAVMGVASIAPAFPQMKAYFDINEQQIALLVIMFTLPGIFLTPVTGILADRLGRKTILIPSVILFGVAGFTCMFIKDFKILLLFRFIQGLGAASLGALNVTIIGDLYSGNKRATAMGYNASVLSIGTATYPALGGFLAILGWNFPFILPLLAIPVGVIIALKLENPEPKEHQNIKEYGKSLIRNVNRPQVYGIFILNVLVFFLIYGAYITYLPLLLKQRMFAESWQIGLAMSAMSFTTAFTSSQAGKLNRNFTGRKILVMGMVMYIVSMMLFAYSNTWWLISIPILMFGVAQGFFLPTVQTMLVGLAPLKERAAFMSLNSMVLRIGQTIGPAVIGFAYAMGGLKIAYFSAAGISLIMLVIVLSLIRDK